MAQTAEPPIAIQVAGLTAGYDGLTLLREVSFTIRRGEVFVILGTSGCGKTTLLRNMIGLETPLAGRVLIEGDDLLAAPPARRRQILRRFGVMFQNGALFGSLSVLENVRLPLEEFTRLDGPTMDLIARMKLHLVGLSAAADRLPGELSGGMQKRAAIARAMALDPGILFLDEPSAGLDPVTSAGLDDLILELSGTLGVTFVVVTHELQSIFAIASRAIMLDRDTQGILATGTPAALRDQPPHDKVRRFFRRESDPPPPHPSPIAAP
ncbi:MAG: ATP-binding cassette domain-containing protein [Verrucomicrobiae bacterium]|nr:ATP-binding cassette domain-containing protein [Verrucomicrobiae bacterium]